MSEYKVVLKPVYSAPASEVPTNVQLPPKWSLVWHQAQTLNALRNPEIDVVINTAMTGDGKSLAAYLRVLCDEENAIALYPTNELARDQNRQVQDYIEKFQPHHDPRVNVLSGAKLELYAEEEGLRKADAVASRASNSEVLLTNPDILHYLHRQAYLTPYENPDKLWNRINKNIDLYIFDEFHVFAAPQVASVLNTMLLIRRTNQHKKFLFLSATPDDQLIEKLEIAGFRYQLIDPTQKNKYKFPTSAEETKVLNQANWRQVSQEITFNFIPLESAFQASENWLKENQELILQHFQTFPNTKGAIILNSVAAVKRLVPILRNLLKPHGLTVGENTGLSGTQAKAQSLSADLVIGTSTIDIGVDFKINFLIFESSDTGNFIQRLGRLGRHSSFQRNGETINFNQFIAYALVPKFLVERLFIKDDAPLQSGHHYDRISFNNVIKQNYRQINNFEGYYKRWGIIQSFQLWWDLGQPNIKQQYEISREKFKGDCEEVFENSIKRAAGRVISWKKEYETQFGKSGNPIFGDAASFRGSSPLQCGLYDETEPHEIDRYKTYDLPGILSNLDIEVWAKSAFLRSLKETSTRLQETIPKGRFQHCLGFMKLKGYRQERLNWRFTYTGKLQTLADAWKVQVLAGIGIWSPDNLWTGAINDRLKKQAIVSYVLPRPVAEVRQRLQLPMHFALYPISDNTSIHDFTPPYSIAMGQSALLLDTLAYRLKTKGGEIWICQVVNVLPLFILSQPLLLTWNVWRVLS